MSERRLILGALVLLLPIQLAATMQAPTGCEPSDPTGYFEGTATSRQAGRLNVSLNLRCEDDHYHGTLVTPVGTYTVEDGAYDGGLLRLHLGAGTDQLEIEGQIADGLLRGRFAAGDDSGPVALQRTGDAHAPGAVVATLAIPSRQWHEDLAFYATEVPKRHINAFHFVSRKRFEHEVALLDRRIDSLDADAIFVGLARLAALIGDGHTHFVPPEDIANLPIDVRRFGDDYRVVAVRSGGGLDRALGAKVLAIDGTPIAQVRKRLLTLTPQDENPNLGLARIEMTMTEGLYLHGLGIIADRDSAHYLLADDQRREFTVTVHAVTMAETMGMAWTRPYPGTPLRHRHPSDPFWCDDLPRVGTLYCNFRGYDGLEGEAAVMTHLLAQRHPNKLVIDLRYNGGGDYTLGQRWVVDAIRKMPALNRRGHLFVLIGPYTFSAGMVNAVQFRDSTAALLVGEPIGEKPNSYQEAREMRLPNSHLLARYSTARYDFAPGTDNVVVPDHVVDRTWASYQAGRDPALEWALGYRGP